MMIMCLWWDGSFGLSLVARVIVEFPREGRFIILSSVLLPLECSSGVPPMPGKT